MENQEENKKARKFFASIVGIIVLAGTIIWAYFMIGWDFSNVSDNDMDTSFMVFFILAPTFYSSLLTGLFIGNKDTTIIMFCFGILTQLTVTVTCGILITLNNDFTFLFYFSIFATMAYRNISPFTKVSKNILKSPIQTNFGFNFKDRREIVSFSYFTMQMFVHFPNLIITSLIAHISELSYIIVPGVFFIFGLILLTIVLIIEKVQKKKGKRYEEVLNPINGEYDLKEIEESQEEENNNSELEQQEEI